MKDVIRQAREELDAKDRVRESLLDGSRDVVRLTKQVIADVHLRHTEKARHLLAKSLGRLHSLRQSSRDCPGLYFSGIMVTAQQEVAEAAILLSLTRKESLPELDSELVPWSSYILGLADAVGELRRECLDALRKGRLRAAEELFKNMEEIHLAVGTLSYPSGLIPGFRQKCDMVRRLVEETRGDVTHASLMLRMASRRSKKK